jgi:hypothetical protein
MKSESGSGLSKQFPWRLMGVKWYFLRSFIGHYAFLETLPTKWLFLLRLLIRSLRHCNLRKRPKRTFHGHSSGNDQRHSAKMSFYSAILNAKFFDCGVSQSPTATVMSCAYQRPIWKKRKDMTQTMDGWNDVCDIDLCFNSKHVVKKQWLDIRYSHVLSCKGDVLESLLLLLLIMIVFFNNYKKVCVCF